MGGQVDSGGGAFVRLARSHARIREAMARQVNPTATPKAYKRQSAVRITGTSDTARRPERLKGQAGESYEARLARSIEQCRRRGRTITFRLLSQTYDSFTRQYSGIPNGVHRITVNPDPAQVRTVFELIGEFFALLARADAVTIREHMARIPSVVTHAEPRPSPRPTPAQATPTQPTEAPTVSNPADDTF